MGWVKYYDADIKKQLWIWRVILDNGMTKQEVNEKFGGVELSFRNYYKYVFYYEGELSGGFRIFCSFGGNGDDIYRSDFSSGEIFCNVDECNSVEVFYKQDRIFEYFES